MPGHVPGDLSWPWASAGRRRCTARRRPPAALLPPPSCSPSPQSLTLRACAAGWTSRAWRLPPRRRRRSNRARCSPTAPRVGGCWHRCVWRRHQRAAVAGSGWRPGRPQAAAAAACWARGVQRPHRSTLQRAPPIRACLPYFPADFRRGAAPEVSKEVAPLLKAYQEEVDRLTSRQVLVSCLVSAGGISGTQPRPAPAPCSRALPSPQPAAAPTRPPPPLAHVAQGQGGRGGLS